MYTLKHSKGGCICGAVRYEITSDPITFLACHCSDCQTITGSGFVLALRIPYDGATVIKGDAQPYERTEADQRKRIIFRCPDCLTVLWSKRPDTTDYITIYAGTLDDSSLLQPAAHIWTKDLLPWISLPNGALQYEENPPDIRPIIAAWHRQNQTPRPD